MALIAVRARRSPLPHPKRWTRFELTTVATLIVVSSSRSKIVGGGSSWTDVTVPAMLWYVHGREDG